MKDIFLVDIDDTLLDFQKAERANLQFTLSSYLLPFDEEILRAFHEINDALWKALERGEIDRETLKVKRFSMLAEKCSLALDAEETALAYWKHFPEVCYPFPGADCFLRELQKRGKIFLVTNGGRTIQREHIRLAGFAPYLSGVFISEEIGSNKPSLEFAAYVEGHIKDFSRGRAVWIGDSLTSDGACAKRSNIDFILFCPSGPPQGYEGMAARDYGEVLGLLSSKN